MSGTLEQCNTILVVEDDEEILSTLRELLEGEGYPVVPAKNGREAIEILEKMLHPCLILLDLFMPIMDGWQFLDQLNRDESKLLTHIPVVITSAAGDRARETAIRVSGYIKKPIDLELLLITVQKYCG